MTTIGLVFEDEPKKAAAPKVDASKVPAEELVKPAKPADKPKVKK